MTARNTLAALQPRADATQQAWAARISACWRASLEAILEVGRLLSAAKGLLPHGDFGAMIESKLPFSARTAQMLMAIAADKRLTNPNHGSHLPASWRTMFELTKLSDEEFDRGVRQQIIRPDMERKDVEIIRPMPPPHRERSESSDGSSPVPPGGVIAGDDANGLRMKGEADDSPSAHGSTLTSTGDSLAPDIGTTQSEDRASPGQSESQMPGGGLAIAHNRVEPSDSLDFFPTPPWATRALVENEAPETATQNESSVIPLDHPILNTVSTGELTGVSHDALPTLDKPGGASHSFEDRIPGFLRQKRDAA